MTASPQTHTIGIISDTHGVLPAAVARAFSGVNRIIHAGDVGREELLDDLGRIAPVNAVRGNMDEPWWAHRLPLTEVVEVGGVRLYVLHDVEQLDLDPAAIGLSAVVHGHTHRPAVTRENGLVFINPGSAARPRAGHAPTVALLRVHDGELSASLIPLR
jgi:putative phosphoesterase